MYFRFDKENKNWNENNRLNEEWLKSNIAYLLDLFKAKEYLYLNQIYETLGFEWSVYMENVVFIYGTHKLEFNIFEKDYGYLIQLQKSYMF